MEERIEIEDEDSFKVKRIHISVPSSLFYKLKTTGQLREIDNLIIDLLTDYLRGKENEWDRIKEEISLRKNN